MDKQPKPETSRRKFLAGAAATASAMALAACGKKEEPTPPMVSAPAPAPAPAPAAGLPTVTWRMPGSWPKSLDTLFGAQEIIAKRVAEATGGKFTIKVFAGGEIVGPLQVLDAVQNGTVECGHTATYYYFGKDPTFALNCSAPFGMNSRQQNAWMYYGGGNELVNEFFKGYNVMQMPAGNTGCQMGGWFRKEIKSVADLKGLKFRVGGFAGTVLAKLGVVPQMIAGGDIYPALEKGTIDAAEWVGPYDDEKLGFYKVAKNYYYPGWWEAGTQAQLLVNLKSWAALPKEYQAVLESACAEANVQTMAKYDSVNPDALKRLVANGVKLRGFSNEIMAACYKAANEVYAETSAKNPAFKKIHDAIVNFQSDQVQWWSIAEDRMDNFMSAAERMSQRETKKK